MTLRNTSQSAGRVLKQWRNLGDQLRFNRRARSLGWTSAQVMIRAAGPVLLSNAERLRVQLIRSNALLSPLADPLLTDYGVQEWLSRSREEAYSDWLAWVVRQIQEPRLLLQLFDIDDPAVEVALHGILLDPTREVFTAEGYPGHTGKIDLRMVVPGKVLIQVELKLGSADEGDVRKNEGYTASTKKYGVPNRHWHRRLLATDGDEMYYSGGYRLVTWGHVVTQLRIIAVQMVKEGRFLVAAKVLGFVGAVEQNLLGFSKSVAESAFEGKPIPLSTGLVSHLEDYLNEKH